MIKVIFAKEGLNKYETSREMQRNVQNQYTQN